MIKSNELRIGNICLRKNKHTEIETIHEFTASCILDISSNGINSSFIYEPIPLTEEILLKCGFKKSNDLDNFYHLEVLNQWTRIYFNPKHKVCALSVHHHEIMIKIQYLHQLQNLIFSLTQKELTIQL